VGQVHVTPWLNFFPYIFSQLKLQKLDILFKFINLIIKIFMRYNVIVNKCIRQTDRQTDRRVKMYAGYTITALTLEKNMG